MIAGTRAMISKSRGGSPIDYLPQRVIPGDKLFVMERARSYHFGVLTSNVHMAWMRTEAGRLEMRYRYSAQTLFYPVLCPLRAPLGMVPQAR